jgi:hypothetical protein
VIWKVSKCLQHGSWSVRIGIRPIALIVGLLLASSFASTSIVGQTALPVFPGAEGFGTTTKAGRGGVVLRVTNLNDSGAGSLRDALSATGPRVVIFDISGTITLTSNDLYIDSPFITVAGQTAPSPGITIRGGGIRVRTHDVLIQHLRIRPGDVLASAVYRGNAGAIIALGQDGTTVDASNTYNLVFDHVTTSWVTDQNISTWAPLHDVTFSNSLITEGLRDYMTPNAGQCHSCGPLLGPHGHRVALIRNVMAHNINRYPTVTGDTTTLILNNLIYNSQAEVMDFYDYNNEGTLSSSIIGNVQINGPNTPVAPNYVYPMIYLNANLKPGSQVYTADNVAAKVLSNNVTSFNAVVSAPPIGMSGITIRPSSTLESYLKPRVGARPFDRDAVDARVITTITARTGRIIDAPADVGGYPTLAVNQRPLTLPSNPNADADGDGYTNLEEWLHGFAAAVETGAPAPPTSVRIVN